MGGACAEGDWGGRLRQQVEALGLEGRVHFLGTIHPEALREPLSAADVFVLSTRNEGWANVLLEAMACGLPVVTTDVGGNAEVVARPELGTVVPFDDAPALQQALGDALARQWDGEAILAYARDNGWDKRIDLLCRIFNALAEQDVMAGRALAKWGAADPWPAIASRSGSGACSCCART